MSYSTLHQLQKKYYQSLTGTFNATKKHHDRGHWEQKTGNAYLLYGGI